jgi:Mn2+/Fe2+ NRAMP family transporter
MSARLGAVAGQGIAGLVREHFPLRVALGALAVLLVADIGLVVSELAGVAVALGGLGVPAWASVLGAAALVWAVVVLGSYTWAERALLVLAMAFLVYPVAAVLGHPDWHAAVEQSVVPHLLGDRSFAVLVVALIGTTITPYMQLFQASAIVDKGLGPERLRTARLDAVVGTLAAGVVTVAIIVATAAAIGGTGPLASADDAARALRPAAGAAAGALFSIGLLGSSVLALAVVPLATAYAVAEAVGAERSVSRRFGEARLFLGLFTAQLVLGAAIALAPGNLVHLVLATQVLNGLVSPLLLGLLVVLAGRRSVLGEHANGPVLQVASVVCVTAIGAMALLVVGQAVVGAR